MPDYRRNRVPGGTYFFTVNLLERRRCLLVAHVDALRAAHMDCNCFIPVKHGWVERVVDWPYSSYHRHVRAGVYPVDWVVVRLRGRLASVVVD